MAKPLFADTHLLRFRFHRCGIVEYPPGATFGPRIMDDYEFVWIIAGEVVWEVDGVQHPAPPDTVILARPGMRDGYRWDPRHYTRHGYFHFDLEPGRGRLPPLHTWPLSRRMAAGDVIRPLFHHLGWLLGSREPGWEELAQGALRQILVAFLSGMTGTTSEENPLPHTAIAAVLEHIQDLWSGEDLVPVTLGDLARVAGMSKAHLTRIFRSELDLSPVEAVRLLRIDRAASLLTRTELPVQEIARSTGFANPFHFSRAFRELYGRSPRRFRAEVREGADPPINQLARWRQLRSHLWGAVPATQASKRAMRTD
jgi:AraC family transcriptional regulator